MRAPDRARSHEILVKRVRRLLHLEGGDQAASELGSQVIPFLSSFGSVALIGGAIRDVARAGKRRFASDYDFVIYGGDRGAFLAQMDACHAVRNRFGGFALNRFSMKIDVWHIEDTWARTAGLAQVSQPADLLQCTFFDWDSAVYEIGARRLVLPPDYFDKLLLNVMDIRLEENPNPMGSLVRAVRRAALWHVKFGPRLTAFCRRLLSEIDWNELVALDAQAFRNPVLEDLDRDRLVERLESSCASDMGEITWPVPEPQLGLPLTSEATELSPL